MHGLSIRTFTCNWVRTCYEDTIRCSNAPGKGSRSVFVDSMRTNFPQPRFWITSGLPTIRELIENG